MITISTRDVNNVRDINYYAVTSLLLKTIHASTLKARKYTNNIKIEKCSVIPATLGPPFKYWVKSMFSNK